MNLPYLLVPYELSDEAAAQLSELFDDLAVAFDAQYFAQIIRYYDGRRESECSRHHNQLELFIDDNDTFQVPCRSRERRRPPRPFVIEFISVAGSLPRPEFAKHPRYMLSVTSSTDSV